MSSAPGVSAQDKTDPREAELEWLNESIRHESNREKNGELGRRISDLYREIHCDKATELHGRWKNEPDVRQKEKLGQQLIDEAVYSCQPDLVTEVTTGGTFAEKEIKVPRQDEEVRLRPLREFEYVERSISWKEPAWIVRRMTRRHFELWTPWHGWLFDAQGRVLNEAIPPRRDGKGREWYGAFLPNGQWVTTDLWEMDRVLTFFSRSAQWQREIAANELVPVKEESLESQPLIGWCRCDKNGTGFVLSVGSERGRGCAWVNPRGHHRLLTKAEEPWKLCYPRDLEPKGFYISLFVPDDSGKTFISRESAGHGSWVGFPRFDWNDRRVIIPEGDTFGFWPDSPNVYIISGRWEAIDPPKEADRDREADQETWFFNSDGQFVGWIAAARIADTVKLDGMLFRDATDRVITLGKDYRPGRVERFVWGDETTARPFKIFPELRLGFFIRGDKLVLGRWKTAPR